MTTKKAAPKPPATVTTTVRDLLTLSESGVFNRVLSTSGMTDQMKYHAAKLGKLVQQELVEIHKQRIALFRQNGVEHVNAKGSYFEIDLDKREEHMEALTALLNRPVVIAWGPLKSTDIPQATVADWLMLGPFCELIEPPDPME